MGRLPSEQGLVGFGGFGGFVARDPSEHVHVGAAPSEHVGRRAMAEEAKRRERRRLWNSMALGLLYNLFGWREEQICRWIQLGGLYIQVFARNSPESSII